jgi:uncharacterized repeat protein (TIGR01451 family)
MNTAATSRLSLLLAGVLLTQTLAIRSVAAAPGASNAPAPVIRAAGAGNPMSATLRDTLLTDLDSDDRPDPGDTLQYEALISNTTGVTQSQVAFAATLDGYTTQSGATEASPLAVNDAYLAYGNVAIVVPSAQGVLVNDFQGIPTATLQTFAGKSENGGDVTLDGDGAFSYNPPAGFEGTDTFTYTLAHSLGNDQGIVRINVSGMLWFVRSGAPVCASGCGRLNTPFASLSEFVGVNDGLRNNPAPGDAVFFYSGVYTGALSLLNNQRVIGAGASLPISSLISGTIPAQSIALPGTGGIRPTVSGQIVLRSGNRLHGLDLQSTGGTALATAVGVSAGALTINEMSVVNTGGPAVNLRGPSMLDVVFGSVSASGGVNGMYVSDAGGRFEIVGDGAPARNGSGGTISGASNDGVRLINVSNVTLSNMTIQSNAGSGIFGTSVNGLILRDSTISQNGDAVQEAGLRLSDTDLATGGLNGLTGDATHPTRLLRNQFDRNAERNIFLANFSGTLEHLQIENNAILNTMASTIGADGVYIETRGNAIASVTLVSNTLQLNATRALAAMAFETSRLTIRVGTTAAGNTIENNYEGIVLGNGESARLSAAVMQNTVSGSTGASIGIAQGVNTNSSSRLNVAIYTNTVSSPASNALIVGAPGNVNHSVLVFLAGSFAPSAIDIADNQVTHNGIFNAIRVDTPTGASTPDAAVTLRGNTATVGASAANAVVAQMRRAGATVCYDIRDNSASGMPSGTYGVYLRQTAGTLNLIRQPSGFATASGVLQQLNPSAGSWDATGTIALSSATSCARPPEIAALTPDIAVASRDSETDRVATTQHINGASKVLAKPQASLPAAEIAVAIGTFPPGKRLSIRFKARIDKPLPAGVVSVSVHGSVAATGQGDIRTDDPDTSATGDATVTALDIHADLRITKTASSLSVAPGDRVTYTLRYANDGPEAAAGVVITDMIPVTLTQVSWASNPVVTATNGLTLAWMLGDLNADASGVITISGMIAGVRAGDIPNRAAIASSTVDTNTRNNTSNATITLRNIAPVAADDTATVDEDTSTTLDALANDGDANGDPLTVTLSAQPAHGIAAGNGLTIEYTPSLNFNGIDVLTYTVSDGALSDQAVLTVTVNPVNDRPTGSAGSDQTVEVNALVSLDSASAQDVDGPFPLVTRWQQTGGPSVTLSDTNALSPTFDAPAQPAVLTFTLSITDGDGLAMAAPDTVVITIRDAVLTGAAAQSDSPTRLTDATHFTASVGSGSNPVYTWNFGDGSATQNGAAVAHTYARSGSYTALLTATNASGFVTTTTTVLVTNLAPVADAGTDQAIPVAANATLDGNASSDPDGHTPLVYHWAQTGGAAIALSDSSAAAPTFTAPATTEVLTFTLSVTDAQSLAGSTDTVVINVADVAILGLTATSNGPTRLTDSTAFTATLSEGTGVTYQWSFGDGSARVNGATAAHVYGSTGGYTVIVTATNTQGSVSTSTRVSVTNAAPIADAGADASALVSATVTLNGSASGDPDGHAPVTAGWQQSGGPAVVLSDAGAISPTFVAPATPAVLTFTLRITDAQGLASVVSDDVVITIGDVPIAGLSATNSAPTRLGNATAFTASISGGSNVVYEWAFGDGTSGSGAAASHTYPSVGAYTTTVTATNAAGTQMATTVVAIIDRAIADLAIRHDAPTLLGGTTALTASVSTGSNVVYSWELGDGTVAVGEQTAHRYAAIGAYTVTVTATNGVSSVAHSTQISVLDVPLAGLTAGQDGPKTIGSAIAFTSALNAGSNAIFSWNFGDGEQMSSALVTHTYAAAGDYNATVTVTNSRGVISLSVPVTVWPTPSVMLEDSVYAIDEDDGPANVIVKLDRISSNAVTVTLRSADGSAQSPVDYDNAPVSIVIPPGSLSGDAEIAIVDDILDESTEDFEVQIASAGFATPQITSTARVRIVDNDAAPELRFATNAMTVTENAGAAELIVELAQLSGLTATVEYLIPDSAITAAQNGTLVFAPGVLTQSLTVPVIDDILIESDVTADITLTATTNARLAAPSVMRLTVLDDEAEPFVAFDSSGGDVFVNDPQTVTVTLDRVSTLTVSVEISIDGSAPLAVLAASQSSAAQRISIPPGERSAVFAFRAPGTPNSFVTLTIGGAINARIAGARQATYRVLPLLTAPPPAKVYLPVVRSDPMPVPLPAPVPPIPDLIVSSIRVTRDDVIVVIRNAGGAAVTDPFWVDLYVDPKPVPARVNDVWNDGRSASGAAWGVTRAQLPLQPGAMLTLTLRSPQLVTRNTNMSRAVPANTVFAAQVDSASTDDAADGAVSEIHEQTSPGGVYNNIMLVRSDELFAGAPALAAARPEQTQTTALPSRPVISR